jgi:hypothetical protein
MDRVQSGWEAEGPSTVKGVVMRERARRRPRPGVATFRSPLTTVVAALALLFQLVAVPYHQARSAPLAPSALALPDVAAIAADLKATFGDAAALCVQTDDKGGPLAPAGDCDDHCPLCQFAAQAAALAAPDLPALPERIDAACRTLGAAPETGAVPACRTSQNRARGPPFAV